jgi:hypothetical protein
MRPLPSDANAMVIYDGSKDATVSRHTSGTAKVTKPAPARKAAIPDSATAPHMPREPPTSSARP